MPSLEYDTQAVDMLINGMQEAASLSDEGNESDKSDETRSNAGSTVSTLMQPRAKPGTKDAATQTEPQVNYVHTVV